MTKKPRIILYSGKGGVGKTSVSAATGLKCARLGYRTIVVSLDTAHSLADSFDLSVDLYDINKGEPVKIEDNLWIQEIDINLEIERHWGDVYKYFTLLLHNSGLDEVAAEELAVMPGMADVVFLLYINKYVTENKFDVLILDCAPTGESLRFAGMPATIEWYMNKAFKIERGLARVIRPVAKIISDIPLPEDSYFRTLQKLYQQVKGVDKILMDRDITTVRLVTNAEKMIMRETQRSFMFFCMLGMQIDCVVINRLIPQNTGSEYFNNWFNIQTEYKEKIKGFFDPVPVKCVPVFGNEMVGISQLVLLGEELFRNSDPCDFYYKEAPYSFVSNNGACKVEIKMPGVKKEYIDLLKKRDELIVKVAGLKRHIMLPKMFAMKQHTKAKFEGDTLCVYFD
jgi:arsenite-transporting ATPase